MVIAGYAEEGTLQMVEGTRYLINPGSVGQPRDGDPRAAYLVLDLDWLFRPAGSQGCDQRHRPEGSCMR